MSRPRRIVAVVGVWLMFLGLVGSLPGLLWVAMLPLGFVLGYQSHAFIDGDGIWKRFAERSEQ